jgi:hypothetical protein
MHILPIHDVSFDDEATLAMGAAFDQACQSLPHSGQTVAVREIIAKRIIEAAKNGELDRIRLHSQAILGLSIDDLSMPISSVGRSVPSPAYAAVAHAA